MRRRSRATPGNPQSPIAIADYGGALFHRRLRACGVTPALALTLSLMKRAVAAIGDSEKPGVIGPKPTGAAIANLVLGGSGDFGSVDRLLSVSCELPVR
jgi:hypothetical protein